MTPQEYIYFKILAQLSVLREVQKEYSGRTIDNIIQNLEARLDFYIKQQNKQNL